MKTKHILIATAMIAAFSMVSCKNNKKVQTQEPTQEEVQEMKQALADSVLAEIDDIVDQYANEWSKSFRIRTYELTDTEKMVKPDYLLDPSFANSLISKTQKVNALAIYIMEYYIRIIYDMPNKEVFEAIAKLTADVNHPVDAEGASSDIPVSEKVKKIYEGCKESGEIAYFWQLESAFYAEMIYIISNNPELFFSRITDEQWQAYMNTLESRTEAVGKLAKYDPEMATLSDFMQQFNVRPSDEERDAVRSSCEAAKSFIIANKEKYAARRNALLQ